MANKLLLTIFGGTGDLTFRKLLPALYNMLLDGQLSDDAEILIVGRRGYTDEDYRARAHEWVERFARLPFSKEAFVDFAGHIRYFQMDFSSPKAFDTLDRYFRELGPRQHIFYFAVAPRFFPMIAQGLSAVAGAAAGKVVLEKPFGEHLAAAQELNMQLEAVFSPQQIYRIDHYLGKEMVRGITAIRFTNPIFGYVWDARQIEYIEISALETVGVETRGGYYDEAGALQDMVQNHLFQILSILAMERPTRFSGTAMHTEQIKVLHALRPPRREELRDTLILGQYEGYREEPSVARDSRTETYAALRVFVDNDRWRNMPFYIRTGKKTGVRETQVTVTFRRMTPELPANRLILHIQPNEGVDLQFNMKEPGETDEITSARMDFCQSSAATSQSNTPEAYERLLRACIAGEQSWFSQWDQIEAGWSFVEQLKALAAGCHVVEYPVGTPGPHEAVLLPKRWGHSWNE